MKNRLVFLQFTNMEASSPHTFLFDKYVFDEYFVTLMTSVVFGRRHKGNPSCFHKGIQIWLALFYK